MQRRTDGFAFADCSFDARTSVPICPARPIRPAHPAVEGESGRAWEKILSARIFTHTKVPKQGSGFPTTRSNPVAPRSFEGDRAECGKRFPTQGIISHADLNNCVSLPIYPVADANDRPGSYLLGLAAATPESTERFDGGTTMEEVAVVSLAQPETDPNSSLTREQAALRLEEAAQRIRTLLPDESNAWELGRLLNTIVKSDLPRKAGWGRTRRWLMANVPEARGRDTTLYRYAHVAAEYTKEQVELWGVRKLDALSDHDHATLREPDPRELSKREIELIKADGSTLTKKFSDCTCREL